MKKLKYIISIIGIGVLVIILYNFTSSTDVHAGLENISNSGIWEAKVDDDNEQMVKLYNLSNGESKEIIVEDSLLLSTSIEQLQWFDNDILAVISHVNPSLECLSIYDIANMDLIDEKYGLDFQWVGTDYTNLYYIEPTPHFSDEVGIESIRNYADETIYQTSGNETLLELAVSSTGKKISFFSQNITGLEEVTNLNILTLDNTGSRSISTPLVVEWSEEIGDLYWKDDENLNVSHVTYEIMINADDGNITSKVEFGSNLDESNTEIVSE